MAEKIASKRTTAYAQKENAYGFAPANWTDETKVIKLHQTGYDVTQKKEKKEDSANLGGGGFPSGLLTMKETIEGKIPLTMHPEQFAKLAYWSLGSVHAAIDIPKTLVYVVYKGTAKSALLNITDTNMNALIGEEGAEAADTNFNATGTIDLTASATDTIAELCAKISTFTGYKAFYIGDGAQLSTAITVFTSQQIKNIGFLGAVPGVSGTAKQHHIIPSFLKPSFSVIADRVIEVEQALGLKADGFSIKISESDLITMEMSVTGNRIITGVSVPTIDKETTQQLQAAKVKIYLDGVLQPGITSLTFNSSNNLLKAGEIGQFGISEPTGQTPSFTIDLETYLTSETQHLKTKYGQMMKFH